MSATSKNGDTWEKMNWFDIYDGESLSCDFCQIVSEGSDVFWHCNEFDLCHICYLKQNITYLDELFQYLFSREDIEKSDTIEMQKYIMQEEYDSEAIQLDFEDSSTNSPISNIQLKVKNKNMMIKCSEFANRYDCDTNLSDPEMKETMNQLNQLPTHQRYVEWSIVCKIIDNILSKPDKIEHQSISASALSPKLQYIDIWIKILVSSGFYLIGNALIFNTVYFAKLKYWKQKLSDIIHPYQLFRLINSLKKYDLYNKIQEETLIEDIDLEQLLTDFLYLIEVDSNHEFECIVDQIGYCDISACIGFRRNNRDRFKLTPHDELSNIAVEILDTIHCYFMHSHDMGYRLTSEETKLIQEIPNIVDDEINFFNKQIQTMTQILQQKRKTYHNIQSNLSGRYRIRCQQLLPDANTLMPDETNP
eukprot:7677_1